MPTSCSTLVRNAITTITNADTTMRTLCGRTTNLILPWRTAVAAQKPVIAYQLAANNRTGGIGDQRRVQVLTAAFAEGTGAQAKVEAMTQRLREILTPTAFQALTPSLDAVVLELTDRDGDDDGDDTSPTATARSDLDLLIKVTAPQ